MTSKEYYDVDAINEALRILNIPRTFDRYLMAAEQAEVVRQTGQYVTAKRIAKRLREVLETADVPWTSRYLP